MNTTNDSSTTKAGIVTVAGFPNAGKSSLLNRLIGETLAITSPKAQTTRQRIAGIRSSDNVQMIILDTPGLLEPKDSLQTSMRQAAVVALRDADVILHVADATQKAPPALATAANLTITPRAPVLLVFNKIDLLNHDQRQLLANEHPDALLCSALSGEGLPELVKQITVLLPTSPYLYPEDELSTQPLRFFCAECVRQAALEQLGEEVPHALACEIEEFREGSSPLYIRAVLYVERESQKRIVIGANGQQIKKLGKAARTSIEGFLGQQVYLDLWVKVYPNWRRSRAAVTRFGYGDPARKS